MDKERIRLEDLKRETPFSVPDDYFDKLPQLIQARIPEKARSGRHVLDWSWQRWAGLTAAMSLVLTLIWVTVPERQGSLGQEPLSDISDAAIVSYLEDENISYFDLSEHKVVQKAFDTDSTMMYYLDGLDDDVLRQTIMDNVSANDAI